MDEITRLVDRLGQGEAAEDEEALSLLGIHGRKAVEALLAACSSTEPRRRAAAVTALGRIGDPRARRTLTLALADRSAAVRAAAATALAAYPSEETVRRIRGMLERERDVEVRARGACTLLDLFHGGTVEALDTLLSLVQDQTEDRRVRLEALKVLACLPPSEARAIGSGLLTDGDSHMARAASRFTGPLPPGESGGVEEALADLDSSDYFTFRRGASLLASLGEAAIPVLVEALRAREADAAACSRAASVLKEIARGRERSVARYLDEVDETVPLGLLVDIVGESRDRTALYHLKGVIDRLEAQRPGVPNAGAVTGGSIGLVRDLIAAKAHYYLARAGSRVAFDSLKSTLARPAAPLMGEILMAVEEIGGPEELLDLIRHYESEEGWMKIRLRDACRKLMRKARLRPDDPILQRLGAGRADLLAEILEPAEPRPGAAPAAASRRRPSPRLGSP